eukprot:5107203-Amphidinium_carterae.1
MTVGCAQGVWQNEIHDATGEDLEGVFVSGVRPNAKAVYWHLVIVTLEVVANFYVMKSDTYCDLRPMPSSDKIWCWSALDKSEDSSSIISIQLRLASQRGICSSTVPEHPHGVLGSLR